MQKITGFDFDVKGNTFTASSDLNVIVESEEIKDIVQQTSELLIEDDENDDLKSTEPTFGEVELEYGEDNNEGIMELKVYI